MITVLEALLAFGVAGADHGGILHAAAEAGSEIGLSLLLGAVGGVVLHGIARRTPSDGARLIITVAVVFIVTAGALALELSPLLANMMFGAVLINLSPSNRRLFMVLEPVTPPIFALFFILAGAELQLSVFAELSIVGLGLVYLAARFAGKFAGAYVGARVMAAPIQRLVTLTVNIVLLSVFINELIGPSISRFGVTRGVAARR